MAKTKQKQSQRRRQRGELHKCFGCPPQHPGWKGSQIRWRRKTPYCPEHVAEFDEQHKPWPTCSQCGGSDFGPIKWNGGPMKTVAVCDECGFEDLAHKYFDELTIKVIASPIEYQDD